jgi:hypothetical protein
MEALAAAGAVAYGGMAAAPFIAAESGIALWGALQEMGPAGALISALLGGPAAAVQSAAPSSCPIGATGKVGEDALRKLGGQSQVFFRTSEGGRFVDQLVGRVAHESKVGYTALTTDIAGQIAKDAELIGTGRIDSAVWHFFESPVTGVGGPSGPLREALENSGIGIVIH